MKHSSLSHTTFHLPHLNKTPSQYRFKNEEAWLALAEREKYALNHEEMVLTLNSARKARVFFEEVRDWNDRALAFAWNSYSEERKGFSDRGGPEHREANFIVYLYLAEQQDLSSPWYSQVSLTDEVEAARFLVEYRNGDTYIPERRADKKIRNEKLISRCSQALSEYAAVRKTSVEQGLESPVTSTLLSKAYSEGILKTINLLTDVEGGYRFDECSVSEMLTPRKASFDQKAH